MATIISTSTGQPQMLPPAPSNGASDLVKSGFTTAQNYASTAFQQAVAFLNQIGQTAAGLTALPPVDGNLPAIAAAIDAFVMPAAPVPPVGLTPNMPPVPAQPTLTPVGGLIVPAAPQFTAQPPSVNLPQSPTPLTTTAPVAPALPTVAIPSAPTVVLPDVPTLLGINVPNEPLLNLPTFTKVLPDSPLAPNFIFSFNEPGYSDGLLTDLKMQLDIWVTGTATGLPPAVEQAIWDRDRQREITASNRKIREASRNYARLGFSKPPGALAIEISQALQDSQDTQITQSREVMIKQADLEQSNRRFAFEQAWKVEEGLIRYNSDMAARALDAAKFAQQVGIDIYHEAVLAYGAQIQGYTAQVEAYKAALQGELAKLDVFRAELEAQKLIGELNVQAVQIYTARVEAAKIVIDMFRAEVDAANAAAAVNKTTIEAYAATVNAYGETVRAKATEYEGYATQVRAEVAKIDVFTAQASAYGAQVGGFKATVDALVATKNVEMDVNQKLPLDVFKSLTEVYRVGVDAESQRIGALAKVYDSNTEVFKAEVAGESSKIGSQTEVYKAQAGVAEATGNLRIEAAKANLQNLIQEVTLLIEAIKGGAQVAAQLAAASMSAINLSGQIGDHTGYNIGYSVSDSNSSSFSNVNSNSESNSTSNSTTNATSQSVSQTVSDLTATNYNYNY